jgi:hypothetical protein
VKDWGGGGVVEAMEHLLCECIHYSQFIWVHLGEIITLYLNSDSHDLISREELSQLNVIYNVPHLLLLLFKK